MDIQTFGSSNEYSAETTTLASDSSFARVGLNVGDSSEYLAHFGKTVTLEAVFLPGNAARSPTIHGDHAMARQNQLKSIITLGVVATATSFSFGWVAFGTLHHLTNSDHQYQTVPASSHQEVGVVAFPRAKGLGVGDFVDGYVTTNGKTRVLFLNAKVTAISEDRMGVQLSHGIEVAIEKLRGDGSTIRCRRAQRRHDAQKNQPYV